MILCDNSNLRDIGTAGYLLDKIEDTFPEERVGAGSINQCVLEWCAAVNGTPDAKTTDHDQEHARLREILADVEHLGYYWVRDFRRRHCEPKSPGFWVIYGLSDRDVVKLKVMW